MHDLATIQRLNREATEQAQRAEAMKRHPAGKRLTEPALDAARCADCGDIIPTADDNMAEHVAEYHSARAIANDAMEAFTLIDAEDYEGETEPEEADVAEQSWGFIRDQIEAAIEADRARREREVGE